MTSFDGKWVLITGASSGIGKAFAEKLSADGAKLILIARRENLLNNLATQLKQQHNTESLIIVKDLSEPNAAQEIYSTVKQAGISVNVLINNAGFGIYGHLHTNDLDNIEKMIRVNITALTSLTNLFLSDMVAMKSGIIINLSSLASFVPIPYFSVYSASKAYVKLFTEILWDEYRREGIQFLTVCPGSTDTEFFQVAKMKPSQPTLASPTIIVDQTLEALEKNKLFVVCGPFSNKVFAQIGRIFSRKILAKIIKLKLKKRR